MALHLPVTRQHPVRLPYPDANSKPWPLNHHAYIHACADALREADPERFAGLETGLPTVQAQTHDIRTAALVQEGGLALVWDELDGWTRKGQQVVPDSGPLLDPDVLAEVLTSTTPLRVRVDHLRHLRAHPIDMRFEAHLARYRRPSSS